MNIQLKPIGSIKTPYNSLIECPHNIDTVNGPLCKITLEKEFVDGIIGLEVNQKIVIMYWLEPHNKVKMICKNHMCISGGLFSTRSPNRPNPIGLAIVKIEKIKDKALFVKGLDCLNGTSLIDIKPAIKDELTQDILLY